MIAMNKIKHITSLFLLVICMPLMAETPPDFASMKDVNQKKKAFFDFIYAYALTENQAILAERDIVIANKDSAKVKALCLKYSKNCEAIDAAKIQSLLKRIDVIPPSLALAQAANESAWGTSRFATKANNYFGQWCFSKGCGLVPLRRNAGTTHEVRKFPSAQGSVKGYIFNLNTGRAYSDIRNMRAKARVENKILTGMDLAAGLSKYSERGQEYVKELRSMISYNKLVEKYDHIFWPALKNK